MNCAAAGSAAVVDTAEGSANHGYVSEIIYPPHPARGDVRLDGRAAVQSSLLTHLARVGKGCPCRASCASSYLKERQNMRFPY